MNLKEFTLNIKNGLLSEGEWLRSELSRLVRLVNKNIIFAGASRDVISEYGNGIISLRPECMYQTVMLTENLGNREISLAYNQPLVGAIFGLIWLGNGLISYGSDTLTLSGADDKYTKKEFLFVEVEKGKFKFQEI